MGGGVDRPRLIPLDMIRREGRRRGYRGEAHEDFVDILRMVDDRFVADQTKRITDGIKVQFAKQKSKKR